MKKVKDAKLDVKVSQELKKEYRKIAEEVYGLNLSEFARQCVEYVATNRPILGKGYAPRGQSLQIAIN